MAKRKRVKFDWRRPSSAVVFSTLAAGLLTAAPASAALPNCSVTALAALNVPNLTITSATDVAATPPNPEYCLVVGTLTTSGEGAGVGSAGVQVQLPANWNSKLLFNGVGGLAGSFSSSANPVDLTLFLAKGYATGVTDTGHVSTNLSWEYISPGVPNIPALTDYFYRAVHEATLATKQLVKSYYSAPISRAYFDGCSNGGKMGFEEATRFPNDYEAIIAGAPWLDPLGTSLWALKNTRALLAAYIPPSAFAAIDAAQLAQCDKVDGVADGLIQDPAQCAFNPDTLVPGTLTQAQANALKLIIAPVRDATGGLVYPGSPISYEAAPGNSLLSDELATPAPDPTAAQPWGPFPAIPSPAPGNWGLAVDIISLLGYYDPSVNLNSSLVETNGVVNPPALELLYDRLAPDIPDDPARLNAFLNKGGKMIIYHGYSDPIISPYRTIWYYRDLAKLNGGYRELQEQVRLFMVPGMEHCTNGVGPNKFDTITALENWVEGGLPPEAIVATKYDGDVIGATVLRTMPLCKYPEEAHYSGTGDVNNAANWSCSPLDRTLLEVGPNGIQAGLPGHPDNEASGDENNR
ncbi:MAG: tannase/feruloyl esterase family alpha/beta hydrolase [Acetobacteraceae bacterium]|nr:tannase/feruloyl esterase family alpha/beta hydrolase [Acetobacteraceae bacterium]